MKNSFTFETRSGVILSLDDLESVISINSLHASETHLMVSDFFSGNTLQNFLIDDLERMAFSNFLYFKSFEVYLISILIFYNKKNDDKITSIRSGAINQLSVSFLRRYDIMVAAENIKSSPGNYLKVKLSSLILKAFVHYLYYSINALFFRKTVKHKSIIRSWVEVSYTLYRDEFENSTVFVYPFGINIRRQLRYLHLLKKMKSNFMIVGLKYSFNDLLKVVLHKRSRDYYYLKLESNAYKNHARFLLGFQPNRVFTTDEFECAGILLNQSLINNSVNVINKAHGIGMYCRYISYDTFEIYSDEQKRYYYTTSPRVNYLLNQNIKKPITPPEGQSNKGKAVVYVHSNVEDLGMKCEIRIQNIMLENLKVYSEKYNVPFIIKIHPNTSDKKVLSLTAKGFVCEKDINMILKSYEPIFFTIISTAYFDYRLLGSFYFYRDKYNDPSIYFGSEIKLLEISKLDEILDKELNG